MAGRSSLALQSRRQINQCSAAERESMAEWRHWEDLSLHPLIRSSYTQEQRPEPVEEGRFKNDPKILEDSHLSEDEPVLITDPRVLEVAEERGWDEIVVDVEEPYSDEHAERLGVLQENDHPEMTPGGEVEYALEWLEVYQEEAQRRQGARTDLTPILEEGERGVAADEACKHVSFESSKFNQGRKIRRAAKEGVWGLQHAEELPTELVELARDQWERLLSGEETIGGAHEAIDDEVERHERAKRRQRYEEREDLNLSLNSDVETKPHPEPVRPFVYPGNKASFAPWIISRMPEHETYVEPFAGAAGVLFNKPPSLVEVLNDADPDVATFYEVLRDKREMLEQGVQSIEFTEEAHEHWRERWFNGDDFEDRVLQSSVFLFLRHAQYLGKAPSPSSFDESGASSFYDRQLSLPDLQKRLTRNDPDYFRERFVERVEKVHGLPEARLRAINEGGPVEVRDDDFETVLQEFDGDTTLAYVDPPYRGGEQQYPEDFDSDDLTRLVDTLNDFDGDWILSYGAEPPEELETEYVEPPKEVNEGIGGAEGETREEWLITNIPENRIGTFRVALEQGVALESDW